MAELKLADNGYCFALGSTLYFKGWIEKEEKKIIYTKTKAWNKEGRVVALASSKGVKLNIDAAGT